MKTFLALLLALAVVVRAQDKAKVKYRFPQFFMGLDQTKEDWWHADNRLEEINKFVEEWRGWQDDAPKLPREMKVVNVTEDVYYAEVLDSETPWILSFIKRNKSQSHLVHSEELYQNL